jgi:hypothetical protein
MPRVNVWIPDELHTTVRSRLPEVNVSQLLQGALQAALACKHEHAVCAKCSTAIDVRERIDVELGRFYMDLMWELETLVARVGTAEGACRVAKTIGERYRITLAVKRPLPRPTRAERHAAKVVELPRESDSRAHHPTAKKETA